ncbi:MAG: DUF937 domain-containing protein [Prevotella sp.]|jgi:uncharacterized protein YidB (DUF937 family)|nr:DUF937 domain-containing protein [Prevotella sp.]
MLDGILDLIKDQALGAITNNADVPDDKKSAAVETTTNAIVDGFKNNLSLDNVSSLLGLSGDDSALTNNQTVNSIQTSVISSLSEKVGLSKEVAGSIAAAVVPALLQLLSKKSGDTNDSFSFDSLLQSFTGSSQKGGGILSTLGKLFGR